MATISSLGIQVRNARKSQKLSAVALAKTAGMHVNTLRAFERGVGNIELARLLSLSSLLGLEVALVAKELIDNVVTAESPGLTTFSRKMAALMPATKGEQHHDRD